jgi:hypothetical protein
MTLVFVYSLSISHRSPLVVVRFTRAKNARFAEKIIIAVSRY